MYGFAFYCPVRVVFGKGALSGIGREAAALSQRVLLVYGQGSVKKNGIYDRVVGSLRAAGVAFAEHAGVQPNPVLSHAQEGIAKARRHRCGAVVAVGGGSVIDEAKAIAAGALYRGDAWDFFTGRAEIKRALPLVAASTLPASGSEMNSGLVLLNEATRQKFVAQGDAVFARAALLDPEALRGLPPYQLACGAADALAHLLEAYMSARRPDARVTDEVVHGLARAVLASARRLQADPADTAAAGSLMWGAALAANGLSVCGYESGTFLAHAVGHSLSALHGTAHGASLALIMPALFRRNLRQTAPRLAAFGRAALDVKAKDEQAAAAQALGRLKAFFVSLGLPATLGQAGIQAGEIPVIAANAAGLIRRWGLDCPREETEKILRLAL